MQDKAEEVKKARKEENGAGSEGEDLDEEEEEGVEGEEDDEEEELPEGDDEELEGEGKLITPLNTELGKLLEKLLNSKKPQVVNF